MLITYNRIVRCTFAEKQNMFHVNENIYNKIIFGYLGHNYQHIYMVYISAYDKFIIIHVIRLILWYDRIL